MALLTALCSLVCQSGHQRVTPEWVAFLAHACLDSGEGSTDIGVLDMPQILCFLVSGFLFALFPQPLVEGDIVVTVTGGERVFLRSLPESDSNTVISSVLRGTQFRLIEETDQWFKVELPDGGEGWIHKSNGKTGEARNLVRVQTAVARIRSQDSVNSEILGGALKNESFPVLESKGQWIRIELDHGQDGWIRQDLLVRVPLLAAAEDTQEETEEDSEAGTKVNGAGQDKEELPEEPPNPETALYQRAQSLIEEGNTTEAAEVLLQFLRTDPDNSDAHYRLGLLYRDSDDLGKAITHLERARNGNPPNAEAESIIQEIQTSLESFEKSETESSDEIIETDLPAWVSQNLLGGWSGPILICSVLASVFLISFILMRRRRMRSIQELISRERRLEFMGQESISLSQTDRKAVKRILQEGAVKRDKMDHQIQEQRL